MKNENEVGLTASNPSEKKEDLNYSVIEKLIESKSGDNATCEDQIFVGDNFVAVIDGATSKHPKKWNGKTSGQMASSLIVEELGKIEKNASLEEVFTAINSSLYSWYEEEGILEEITANPVMRPTASLVIFSISKRQLWMVGDCQAMLDNNLITNEKKIDKILAKIRAVYLKIELRKGKTVEELLAHDTGRKAILPFLKKQASFLQNSDGPFSYGAIDGFFTDFSKVKIVDVGNDVEEIVLASDGYPKLKPTLGESESALAEILKEDPLCFRLFESTKGLEENNASFDDRAYVKIGLGKNKT